MEEIYKLAYKLDSMNLKEEAGVLLRLIKYSAPIIEVFDSEGTPVKKRQRVYEGEISTQQNYVDALKHYSVNLFQINLDFLSLVWTIASYASLLANFVHAAMASAAALSISSTPGTHKCSSRSYSFDLGSL